MSAETASSTSRQYIVTFPKWLTARNVVRTFGAFLAILILGTVVTILATRAIDGRVYEAGHHTSDFDAGALTERAAQATARADEATAEATKLREQLTAAETRATRAETRERELRSQAATDTANATEQINALTADVERLTVQRDNALTLASSAEAQALATSMSPAQRREALVRYIWKRGPLLARSVPGGLDQRLLGRTVYIGGQPWRLGLGTTDGEPAVRAFPMP